MSIPGWIEGEQESPDFGPDRGCIWWVRTDDGPVVRVACHNQFLGRQAVADFPVPAAKQLRDQLDAAIHDAEAASP
jgi:hypothetical protein